MGGNPLTVLRFRFQCGLRRGPCGCLLGWGFVRVVWAVAWVFSAVVLGGSFIFVIVVGPGASSKASCAGIKCPTYTVNFRAGATSISLCISPPMAKWWLGSLRSSVF